MRWAAEWLAADCLYSAGCLTLPGCEWWMPHSQPELEAGLVINYLVLVVFG